MIKVIEIKSGPGNKALCSYCNLPVWSECQCHEEGKINLSFNKVENFKIEIDGFEFSASVAPNLINSVGHSWQVSVWNLSGKCYGFKGIFKHHHGPAVSTTRQDLVDWLAEPIRVGGGGPEDVHIYRVFIIKGFPFYSTSLTKGSDHCFYNGGERQLFSPDNERVLFWDDETKEPYTMSVSEVYYWEQSDIKQIRRRIEDRLRKSESCIVIEIAQILGVSLLPK